MSAGAAPHSPRAESRGLRALAVGAVVALLSTGCARCGGRSAADAGAVGPTAVAPPAPSIAQSVDLRTVLLHIFPEYRGVTAFEGTVSLTRRFSGEGDAQAMVAAVAPRNGFTRAVDGGAGWTRGPYQLTVEKAGADTLVRLAFSFDGETMQRVMEAPTPVSSLELGLLLPTGAPGLAFVREDYLARVTWKAFPLARAGFLAKQVYGLLAANGQWAVVKAYPETLDGGLLPGEGDGDEDGGVGEAVAVEGQLRSTASGAVVTVRRKFRQGQVDFALRTDGAH